MAALAVVVILIMVATAVTEFISWVRAAINAARFHDRIWFLILLVSGLLGFGFIAVVIYLIAVG